MRHQLVVAELPQNHRLLFAQHTCVQQLRQQALQPVRVFTHILQEQHPPLDLWQVGCAHQRGQHGQVTAPEGCLADIEVFGRRCQRPCPGLGHTPAGAFAMAGQQVIEAGFHDVVGLTLHPEVGAQGRPGPGGGAGLGQQCRLKGGEVADPHELGAPLHRLGDVLVGQAGQQAGQSIPTA